jgi:heat shock protein HslJ
MRHAFRVVASLCLAGCAGGGAGNPEPEGGAVANRWVEINPKPEAGGPVTTIFGVIRHLDVEGGLFVIQDAGGTNYNPTNLPGAFREAGKAVEAEARERDDIMSIGMVGSVIDLVRIRERSAGRRAGAEAARDEAPSLAGTKWRLEDLAGKGVADSIEATLEFGDDGRVSGNASCNTFRGTATITGDAIAFGPLATTRKMCPGPAMAQETAYLAALGESVRYEIRDSRLYLHVPMHSAPLVFVPA